MMTHAQVIDRWPTITAFAADIGVAYVTAQLMRHRGSIAARHWLAVVRAAKARGFDDVSLEGLAAAAAPMPPAGRPRRRSKSHQGVAA